MPCTSHLLNIPLSPSIWNHTTSLGDDEFPTHAIVCDRLEEKMYVGDYPEVEKFLNIQHPPLPTLSPEEVEQLRHWIEEELANFDISTFQKLGMFELLAGHNQQQKQELVELGHWLDQQVTEDLLRRYLEAANKGNWTAISVLPRFLQRIPKNF